MLAEQTLEDPVVQSGLSQLVAVEDRVHALPALLQEGEQRRIRGGGVEPLDGMENPGRPVDAEAALARAHSQPERAADVVEVRRASPLHRILEPLPRDQLALADDLLRLWNGLARAKPRAELVEAAVLGVRQRFLVRATGPLDPEL
jgi:hypothetical protein